MVIWERKKRNPTFNFCLHFVKKDVPLSSSSEMFMSFPSLVLVAAPPEATGRSGVKTLLGNIREQRADVTFMLGFTTGSGKTLPFEPIRTTATCWWEVALTETQCFQFDHFLRKIFNKPTYLTCSHKQNAGTCWIYLNSHCCGITKKLKTSQSSV